MHLFDPLMFDILDSISVHTFDSFNKKDFLIQIVKIWEILKCWKKYIFRSQTCVNW